MVDRPNKHLTEQLHRAIHAGLFNEVKKLIINGAQMDHVLGMRGTALCAAIEARHLDMVKYLLQLGCDVNARDYDGEPPILLALRKDSPGHISGRVPSLDIIEAILQHDTCNVNKVDPLTKKSAIHFAVEQGMVEAVRWLIGKTGAFKCKINAADLNGNTPLHLAVHEGVSDVVQVLVDHPECLIKVYNKAGLTPVHIAANTGDTKSLTILLKRLGSNKNKLNNLEGDYESELVQNINAVTMFEKESPLHLAVRNGHQDVMSKLLDSGANVNLKNNLYNTPLMLSMVGVTQWQTMNNSIPKALLKNGANPNVRSTVRCRYLKSHLEVTPLAIAIYNQNLELVKCLIANGADVNMVDNTGDTPLNIALKQGHQQIAIYLLSECTGINVNIQNSEGESSLHASLRCYKINGPEGSADLVRKLIKSGAEIVTDAKGKTVIEKAIDYDNPVVLDVIFQETDLSAHDYSLVYQDPCLDASENESYQYSLIHMAAGHGLLDIVKVLLSHGADIDSITSSGESNLHIALYNREYKVARYLVENGCSLVNESYIFVDKEKVRKPLSNQARGQEDEGSSDDDSSDETDSEYDSDDSENGDIFHGNEKLKLWIRNIALNPRTLKLACLMTIRKWFINNQIALKKVDMLTLPDKLKASIRYKV